MFEGSCPGETGSPAALAAGGTCRICAIHGAKRAGWFSVGHEISSRLLVWVSVRGSGIHTLGKSLCIWLLANKVFDEDSSTNDSQRLATKISLLHHTDQRLLFWTFDESI